MNHDEHMDMTPQPPHRLMERFGVRRETAYFSLDGMWCAACANVAQKVLARSPGVVDAQISFAAGKGRVDYDPGVTDVETLLHAVEKLGYGVRLASDSATEGASRAEESLLIQVLVAFAFGMQEMVLYIVRLYPAYAAGDFSHQVRVLQVLALVLAAPALFYGGRSFLIGAWHEVAMRMPGMDTLVALGTLAAFSYSTWATVVGAHATYFDSVTMIVQFIVLGRYIEQAGGARARKDVRGLLELQPDRAWVRTPDGRLEEMPARHVTAGTEIVVKPGERVPLDAEVTGGSAQADESMLTGEAVRVIKRPGDTVWAGTLIADGSVTATVSREVGSSRLSAIRGLVERTLEERAPIERLADRVSLYLTVGVIALALATGAAWALAGHGTAAIVPAVAVLVVACPCALGLATPLAVSIALGGSAKLGVLVRNGAVLETAGNTAIVCLDKTGTVTVGRLEVTGVEGDAAGALLDVAASAEQFSEHPLARAIIAAVPGAPPRASAFMSRPGHGVSVTIDATGEEVRVGRIELMPEAPEAALADSASAREAGGETVVWVSRGGRVLGFVGLRDAMDPTSAAAVRELVAQGREVVILSGDSEATTAAVARELGVSRLAARLTPESKAAYVSRLREGGALVAMVGDGVNDAPSLAGADVSITVAGGTDVAGQTSDVVFDRADLTLVPWFLSAAGRTRRVIRQNLGWALAYNVVALPLAAIGLITPAIAAIAMASSSLLVVGNSLRLRGMLRPDAAADAAAGFQAQVDMAGD
jgi:heavy metal translocating P-type ATPase